MVTVTLITDRERILDKELFWKEVGRAWELSMATGGHPNVQNSSDDYLSFICFSLLLNQWLPYCLLSNNIPEGNFVLLRREQVCLGLRCPNDRIHLHMETASR